MDAIRKISEELDIRDIKLPKKVLAKIEPISKIVPLDIGMTNKSYKLKNQSKEYILRIPGKGTEKLISREQEHDVYKLLKGKGIGDKIIYISPKTGCKISEYWDSARNCDPQNKKDVKEAMEALRKFHEYKLEVEHSFDLFGKIEYYEELWEGNPSRFEDYEETKAKIMSLKDTIESLPRVWKLTHIDPVPDNILFVDGDVRIIDWEYASMQDQHLDIAMFAIYSMYSREEVDQLIDIYFQGKCSQEIRIKIYAYVAVAGLLWSNWSEYKKIHGEDFDEYGLSQYNYAKDYYEIVKQEYGLLEI